MFDRIGARMSQISTFAAATYAAIQGVRQVDEKVEQTQRSQTNEKDAGQTSDVYVPTVESSDGISGVHDETPRRDQKRRSQAGSHEETDESDDASDESHLDVQA